MKLPKICWPNLQQWTFLFTLAIWIFTLVCTGVVISIFCWIAKHGARVVLPSILIAALAQPAGAQISTYDPAGNVTIILESADRLDQWHESAWRIVLAVNKATMIGQSLVLYSNDVQIASFAILPPPGPDGTQLIDLSSYIHIATNAPSKFIRWRIPTHDLSGGGVQPNGTIVIVTCGVAVLVVGGIVVYQMVKMCNRLLTNNVGTNVNPSVLAASSVQFQLMSSPTIAPSTSPFLKMRSRLLSASNVASNLNFRAQSVTAP